MRLRSYFPCIENVDVYFIREWENIWHNIRNSWRKNRFLIPFFERKHTIHRCLNGDFQFQCSNRALLFNQKYKWHTFAVLFLIFVASVDPLSKNKSRIIIQKCWNFCKQLTLPGQTATSSLKTVRLYTVLIDLWLLSVKNVLEYSIALLVV